MKKPNLVEQQIFTLASELKSQEFTETEDKPLYTGRYLVTATEDMKPTEVVAMFKRKFGLTVANSLDFEATDMTEAHLDQDIDTLFYHNLGVALVDGGLEQIEMLQESRRFIVQPEKVVYIPEIPASLSSFSIGSTWGLEAIQAIQSNYTGKGVKVAVLDTGFDLTHPDFSGRQVIAQSFVYGETAQDSHGHGTHCVGTACGYTDQYNNRYGVASDAIIYVGKVLNKNGRGAQGWILDAMDWAIQQKCQVISMSLGSTVYAGQGYDFAYEKAAQAALSNGCIMVAAAGNDSYRSLSQFNPVASPADCPSILAVAALDNNYDIANFSNRAINPTGTIDIAAPGVNVLSSWLMPTRYRSISGTSMATPHVAGIVALLWEKNPMASPIEIINELKVLVHKLPALAVVDVGDGLAISP